MHPHFGQFLYKKDCISIENVQRRAIKMVHSITHLNYSDRKREFWLPSLQYRKTRADLIEVCKILNSIDKFVIKTNYSVYNPIKELETIAKIV